MQNNFKNNTYQKYLLDIVSLYNRRPDLKVYLEILLSIITIAGFTFFAIKPTLITIATLVTKINSLQETSNTLDTKIKNLSLAQNIYNQEQSKIDILKKAIPTSPEVANYVRQIEGLIKKENLTTLSLNINDIALTNEATNEGTTSKPLVGNFSVSGTFTQLQSFLEDLETYRRPSIINKLTVTVGDDKNAKTLNIILTPETPFIP